MAYGFCWFLMVYLNFSINTTLFSDKQTVTTSLNQAVFSVFGHCFTCFMILFLCLCPRGDDYSFNHQVNLKSFSDGNAFIYISHPKAKGNPFLEKIFSKKI